MRRTVLYGLAFFLVCTSLAIADVTISVSKQLEGRPNAAVEVPITIDNGTGVAGGSITLTFDSDVLTANRVEAANLITDFRSVGNIVGNEVRFAFANATGLSGSGAVANVLMTVNSNAKFDGSSALTLSKAAIYDENAEAIPTTQSYGLFTVTPPMVEIRVNPSTVADGESFTLTVETQGGATVTADLSTLDTTQTEPVTIPETEIPGTYTKQITVSQANGAGDGTKEIKITVSTESGSTEEQKEIELRNLSQFVLTIPEALSVLHLPLAVKVVNDEPMEIRTVSDLYDAIGSDKINFIITYVPPSGQTLGEWKSYFIAADRGSASDQTITDDMGILVRMKRSVTLNLKGDALGTDGRSQIALHQGLNFVGVPLMDSRIQRVSDLFTIEGIKDNVGAIIVFDNSEFKTVARPGDPGDVPITGGQAFILIARDSRNVEITGDGWDNVTGNAVAAAPLNEAGGPNVGYIPDGNTPVLAVHGSMATEEVTGCTEAGFHITVTNLSTGATIHTRFGGEDGGQPQNYRLTFVDLLSGYSAQIGDILQVSAETSTPNIGVQPLRYHVTQEDVRASRIHLPDLVAYDIPSETKLLLNYPNPFNPETWIPYRLAEDAFVTLSIYDVSGTSVRTIEVGHTHAAVYESKGKAIYWDGRNNIGERVASGLYFYILTPDKFTETRKMLILK